MTRKYHFKKGDKMNNRNIYNFINQFWKFIKHTEIPTQADREAWDKVVDEATEVTKEYQTSDPMHVLFRTWMMAYLDYMSTVSKGMPTLMQECNEVVKAV